MYPFENDLPGLSRVILLQLSKCLVWEKVFKMHNVLSTYTTFSDQRFDFRNLSFDLHNRLSLDIA